MNVFSFGFFVFTDVGLRMSVRLRLSMKYNYTDLVDTFLVVFCPLNIVLLVSWTKKL